MRERRLFTQPGPAAAPVIAVDGPSGVGKGTLCARLCDVLGWHILDSGAIYRLLGLAAERHGISPTEEQALTELARSLDISFTFDPGAQSVRALLAGDDVSPLIRTEEAGKQASLVAAVASARVALLQRQREFCRPPGLIADGRDMGTVVFPEAVLKIFLTASADERAVRRHKQLRETGISANLAALSAEIDARDRRDIERAAAPLRPAHDAVEINTTLLPADAVCAQVLEHVNALRLGEIERLHN
ncbi:MAG: (d)CMP kinase [Chromatiales bacterium]|jgi:CMP/dCMP kinase|nr:(d)CMP kinase [Chromatiales bacterium]